MLNMSTIAPLDRDALSPARETGGSSPSGTRPGGLGRAVAEVRPRHPAPMHPRRTRVFRRAPGGVVFEHYGLTAEVLPPSTSSARPGGWAMMRSILAMTRAPRTKHSSWADGRVRRGAAPLAVSYCPAGWSGTPFSSGGVCRGGRCLGAPAIASGLVAVASQSARVDARLGPPAAGAGAVIVWQCRRTAEFCRDLRARGLRAIHERTGLQVDPSFREQMRWLLDHIPTTAGPGGESASAPWTPGSSGTSPAARCTDLSGAARTGLLACAPSGWMLPRSLRRAGPASEPHPSAHVYGRRQLGPYRRAAGRIARRRFPRRALRPRGVPPRRGQGDMARAPR